MLFVAEYFGNCVQNVGILELTGIFVRCIDYDREYILYYCHALLGRRLVSSFF